MNLDLNAAVSAFYHSPAAMLALGVATAHAKLILHYAVLASFKFQPLRRYLWGHPQEAKAGLAAFVAEVDADIDELAAAHAAATAAPEAPTPAADAPKAA